FEHVTFSWQNPNRVRSLIVAFVNANVQNFHAIDGSGYAFLTDQLIHLNDINPQIASRLITPLLKWQKFDNVRGELMRQQLVRLSQLKGLAPDLSEKVDLSLT
ncbi:MAG: aminopeptidase N C-terminal domain-containing protein, partial [Gammaproteobacteria bacterium]|nr:aminopeptidase N C-terminal domain-containing protein [Gammaproteobacteria bacterium]